MYCFIHKAGCNNRSQKVSLKFRTFGKTQEAVLDPLIVTSATLPRKHPVGSKRGRRTQKSG